MKSIQFLIETICSKIFRYNNLRNKNFFPIFFLRSRNLDSTLNIFKQKDDPRSWCVLELSDSEKRG